MPNWNDINNSLSEFVLAAGRLEELLSELGCDASYSAGGRALRGPCPVHLGAGQNFVAGTDGEEFPIFWACHSHHCHKTGKLKGNLLGLVRGALTHDPHRPASMTRAVQFIKDFLARGDRPATARWSPPRPTWTALSLTREQVRQQLVIPSPYFLSRGFSAAVLDRFDIGESLKLRNRAVAPVYDDTGSRCISFLTRSTRLTCTLCNGCHDRAADCRGAEPRWRFEAGFPKGEYLYNYATAVSAAGSFVLLVEGVPDVLRAAEAGIVAVSGFGTGLSVMQMQKLAVLNKPVVVAFDNDDAGRAAAPDLARMLRRGCVRAEVRHPPAAFKDVGEMPAEAVSQWLAA